MPNDFIYGLIGGLTGTVISHPFDTIKTRIQSCTAIDIKSAIKMKKLYSGITPPLFGIMLEKSIVFGFYEKMKILGYNDFISGLVGGFISTIIVTPIDRLKINYQNKTSIKITNLYKGFTPTIFRETPGFGIYFSTYNYLNKNYNSNNYLWNNFIFGSISGLTSWIFIYPSDLIKTKYQSSNNISLINVIKNIYYNKNKGFINFYNGFNLAIMRAMPLHGGVFLGYEMAKKYFITPF
jgi:solute carrier family 25 carnitine/acylcarnitine transporter 20/29